MASQAKQLFGRNRTKHEDEDEKDEKELEEEVRDNSSSGSISGAGAAGTAAARRNIAAANSGENPDEPPRSLVGSGLEGTTNGNTPPRANPDEIGRLMPEIRKASAVLQHKALKDKNKRGAVRKILGTVTSVALRTTGTAVGALSGLAMGSPTAAIRNAVLMNQAGGTVARGVQKIAGYAVGNKFQGLRMRHKVMSGKYDDELRQAGVDVDALYESAKADIIRKALAKQMQGTRKGGKALGDVKFTKVVEQERRDQY
jgi:hypothetical protein